MRYERSIHSQLDYFVPLNFALTRTWISGMELTRDILTKISTQLGEYNPLGCLLDPVDAERFYDDVWSSLEDRPLLQVYRGTAIG